MTDANTCAAIDASIAPPRTKPSNYPEPFFSRMAGRIKRPLGDMFGLKNFGVNLTTSMPGAESALFHQHTKQDEFIYIVHGEPTLVLGDTEIVLRPGMCSGFPANGPPHKLINRTQQEAVYLEIGDRTVGDRVHYPKDDIQAILGTEGKWMFAHKDGSPY